MDLQHMIASKLHYYKQLQKQIDAHQTKEASIVLRKKFLERQKVANYQNEYDRIRGMIAQNERKGVSVEHLKKKAGDLQKLGARAIDGIA